MNDSFGPIKGAQPEGTTWATNYPHTAWLEMSQYYITAFKTGSYPAVTVRHCTLFSTSDRKLSLVSLDRKTLSISGQGHTRLLQLHQATPSQSQQGSIGRRYGN